ncbi:hypothetical protein THAOC_37362, partial [Thalassiosira oceanica]
YYVKASSLKRHAVPTSERAYIDSSVLVDSPDFFKYFLGVSVCVNRHVDPPVPSTPKAPNNGLKVRAACAASFAVAPPSVRRDQQDSRVLGGDQRAIVDGTKKSPP